MIFICWELTLVESVKTRKKKLKFLSCLRNVYITPTKHLIE